jgi:hypothetical protein
MVNKTSNVCGNSSSFTAWKEAGCTKGDLMPGIKDKVAIYNPARDRQIPLNTEIRDELLHCFSSDEALLRNNS